MKKISALVLSALVCLSGNAVAARPVKKRVDPYGGIKYAVFNYKNGKIKEQKNAHASWPVASLTKLMAAFVFLNNSPDVLGCSATIGDEDMDRLKGTRTKLSVGTTYDCLNLLEVMLVASDNAAAAALSRSIPGWSRERFVEVMNMQVKNWGLKNTNFQDPSGLSPQNRSTVDDYRIIAINILQNPVISVISSAKETLSINRHNKLAMFRNTSKLIREDAAPAVLSKTGYIRESGYNLVHLADCKHPIGIIEFGARSSNQRAQFIKEKLSQYGCESPSI